MVASQAGHRTTGEDRGLCRPGPGRQRPGRHRPSGITGQLPAGSVRRPVVAEGAM